MLKDVEVGVRGQNKVSAMAKDLADKISADRKPPPPPPTQEPRPVSQCLITAVMCGKDDVIDE